MAKINVKAAFEAIPDVCRLVGKFGKKNLPTILTCAGAAGFGVSLYLMADEAPRAQKAIEIEKEKLDADADISLKERVKIWLQYCWISMSVAAASAAAVLGANKINLSRIAGMTMLYQATKSELDDLRNKVIEKDGKTALGHMEREIHSEKFRKMDISKGDVIETGKGDTLFIDLYTGAKFHSSIEYVNTCITELNTRLQEDSSFDDFGYLELSEFLDMLGEDSKHIKCGKHAAFRRISAKDVIHPLQILDWQDYIDPITNNPRVCFIDYSKFLTPSDDFVERRPY